MHSINSIAHIVFHSHLVCFVSVSLPVCFHLFYFVSFAFQFIFILFVLWPFLSVHFHLSQFVFIALNSFSSCSFCVLCFEFIFVLFVIKWIPLDLEPSELPVIPTQALWFATDSLSWWYLICPNWDLESTIVSFIDSTQLHQFHSNLQHILNGYSIRDSCPMHIHFCFSYAYSYILENLIFDIVYLLLHCGEWFIWFCI